MQGLIVKAFQIIGTMISVGSGGSGLYELWKALRSFRDGDGSGSRDALIGGIAGLAGIALGVLVAQIPSFAHF